MWGKFASEKRMYPLVAVTSRNIPPNMHYITGTDLVGTWWYKCRILPQGYPHFTFEDWWLGDWTFIGDASFSSQGSQHGNENPVFPIGNTSTNGGFSMIFHWSC